ncbi:MAG TPA: TonB-dependent receptor [Bacteroidales bacterium]|nr:TonB-dependent receptor [Bacteroidales bacterium]HRX97125.1 TonB-dependent receptor [Bacteroidales bacterium]
MIRMIMMWLFVGMLVKGYAQIVTITDENTGQPLEYVTILSDQPKLLVISGADGKADISPFKGAAQITFRMIGYKTLTTSYGRLAERNFSVVLAPSVTSLDQVVISAYRDDISRTTGLHIEPLQKKEIEQLGAFNLTDAISSIPGVAQLSTGPGISKPVIRGLYGNRILVLFSGLRFDNQQWQDEHGLGLSSLGISKVEVIKGPLSILYGTEAMGGVINIIEEAASEQGTIETDAGVEFHSNTLGGLIQAGTAANKGNKWYRFRLGAENHADYSDGNGERVLNSRFNGYYLKGTYGFEKERWRSENHYDFSYNNFGFIFNDVRNFFNPDSRWSRSMAGPHHIVMLNILSSVNTIRLQHSTLKVNTGIQSNYRAEDEGGNALSLQMHLVTGEASLKWSKLLGNKTMLVLANNASVENNTNYGKRKIVPDAWMAEDAFSVYLKQQFNTVEFEYGMGAGFRFIKTLTTPTVNSEEKDIPPFAQWRGFTNALAGLNYTPFEKWTLKLNFSTGVRAPNLAELSSNGLHEGIYTYEIGDPNMKNEKNLSGDLGIIHEGRFWQLSTSVFLNHFFDYIYLDPTGEEWFGFPVYRYRQHNANIYGLEAVASITPAVVNGLKLSAAYSGLVGELANGEFLPWMPAQKITPEIRYGYSEKADWSAYGFVNSDFVFTEDHVNPMEQNTPAYTLVNFGLGFEFKAKKASYELNLTANNLLDEAYYDHLSRLKTYDILNMGRDISIHLKIKFINHLKS